MYMLYAWIFFAFASYNCSPTVQRRYPKTYQQRHVRTTVLGKKIHKIPENQCTFTVNLLRKPTAMEKWNRTFQGNNVMTKHWWRTQNMKSCVVISWDGGTKSVPKWQRGTTLTTRVLCHKITWHNVWSTVGLRDRVPHDSEDTGSLCFLPMDQLEKKSTIVSRRPSLIVKHEPINKLLVFYR